MLINLYRLHQAASVLMKLFKEEQDETAKKRLLQAYFKTINKIKEYETKH